MNILPFLTLVTLLPGVTADVTTPPIITTTPVVAAPADNVQIPQIGAIDDYFLGSTVYFQMGSFTQMKYTDIVASDLKLTSVTPLHGLKWTNSPTEEIDVTPGVIALVELSQDGDKNASDPSVTAGPAVADPAKEVVFALTQDRFVRGFVTGYDGQVYQIKTSSGQTQVNKTDLLCYGVIVPAKQYGIPDEGGYQPIGGTGTGSGQSTSGDVFVHGYFRKDGTFVHSYVRARPGYGTHSRK